MIKETGRVVAIETDGLWVETIRQSTCGSCSVKKACGHQLLNKVGTGQSHHIRVLLGDLSPADFNLGDEVAISIPEAVLVKGALLVYMLPLVTMLLGAVATSRYWAGDLAAFAGALAGFLLGVAVVQFHAIANRDNKALQPTVIARSNLAVDLTTANSVS